MGSLSVSTHRGLVHWKELLVAVSLFNFWCPATTAHLNIVSTSVAEGEPARLSLCNAPPNVKAFVWYRGQSRDRSHMIAFSITYVGDDIKGPAYSGRERVTSNGSLVIDNATMNDGVMYTVEVYATDVPKLIGFGWPNVYEPELVVSLDASSRSVTENKDSVVLTCKTNTLSIHWLFNGMNLQLNERMKMSKIHQSLTIDPVKREDAGTYQCEVSNPIKTTVSLPLMLHVKLSDSHFLT